MSVERFPVEEGTILQFARAIGDPNPVYADPGHPATIAAGGILAPPTYVQASAHFDPENPLRPRFGEAWFGSGRDATGIAAGEEADTVGLHAEQRFRYHRPLRPGDILAATTRLGKRWEKEGRSGSLEFEERITDFRDEAGELVLTALAVGVRVARQARDQG